MSLSNEWWPPEQKRVGPLRSKKESWSSRAKKESVPSGAKKSRGPPEQRKSRGPPEQRKSREIIPPEQKRVLVPPSKERVGELFSSFVFFLSNTITSASLPLAILFREKSAIVSLHDMKSALQKPTSVCLDGS
ncbi:hypothetical protein MLD38_009320 [Melastoma candidum]|uniref:Uncharacterized protein n=1 Tax=Melastoma candidum TaxID=119954 RepID=A0ACB9RWV4_9MYRT|nr:hypothetical protein MLD38_009320 [Melastoma candidum]